jgi:hypothetical protein
MGAINATSKIDASDMLPPGNAPNLTMNEQINNELGRSQRSDSLSSKIYG